MVERAGRGSTTGPQPLPPALRLTRYSDNLGIDADDRAPSRHAGYAHPQDARRRTAPRLRDRADDRRGHRSGHSDRRRFALSRAVSRRTQGLGAGRVAALGPWPARQVLPADAARPQAAGRADCRVGALLRRRLRSVARHMSFFNRVFWRPPVADEVDEELEFHLEMRARDLVARGMPPEDARRDAERRFGSVSRTRNLLRTL